VFYNRYIIVFNTSVVEMYGLRSYLFASHMNLVEARCCLPKYVGVPFFKFMPVSPPRVLVTLRPATRSVTTFPAPANLATMGARVK